MIGTSFTDLFFSQSLNQTFNQRGNQLAHDDFQAIDVKRIINKLLVSTKTD